MKTVHELFAEAVELVMKKCPRALPDNQLPAAVELTNLLFEEEVRCRTKDLWQTYMPMSWKALNDVGMKEEIELERLKKENRDAASQG